MTDDELTVRLLDAMGEPVPVVGVHLALHFYIEDRFRYSFSLGRTDDHAVCRTTLREIGRELEANRRFFLMDFNTPLDDCDTMVGVVTPTASELVQREASRLKWWPEKPSIYVDAANDRVRCPTQKFGLQRGRDNAFNLICEAGKG